tara:strand:+ start:321 stop:506 length:186 start_codon:yes stop_codon:yes gene_type:complete
MMTMMTMMTRVNLVIEKFGVASVVLVVQSATCSHKIFVVFGKDVLIQIKEMVDHSQILLLA